MFRFGFHRHERTQAQQLRDEQDEAYYESVRADQEKVSWLCLQCCFFLIQWNLFCCLYGFHSLRTARQVYFIFFTTYVASRHAAWRYSCTSHHTLQRLSVVSMYNFLSIKFKWRFREPNSSPTNVDFLSPKTGFVPIQHWIRGGNAFQVSVWHFSHRHSR